MANPKNATAAAAAQATEPVNRVVNRAEGAIAARAAGAKDYVGMKIRSAAYSAILNEDGSVRNSIVTLTVDKPVVRYVANSETGVFELASVSHFTVSALSLFQVLKDVEIFAPFVRRMQQNPKLLEMLLPGSSIDVIASPVAAGVDYTNPFTGRVIAGAEIEHDTFFFEPLALTAGTFAQTKLDQIATQLLLAEMQA